MLKWITVCLIIPMLAAGQVMELDGVDQYIVSTDTPFDYIPSQDFTVAAWLKTDNSADHICLVGKWNNAATKGWFVSTLFGDPLFQWSESPTKYAYRYGNTDLSDGEWHHVIWVHDSTGSTADNNSMSIFVDGIEESSYTDGSSGVADETAHDTPLAIGWRDTIIPWDGSVDDVRIYNTALSSNQVYNLYQGIDPTNTLVLHMPFDYDDDQFPDLTGNGNDGTAYNSPTIEAAR